MPDSDSPILSGELNGTSVHSNVSIGKQKKKTPATYGESKSSKTNILIKFIRAVLGYRKTSLTLFVILTFIATITITALDNSLEYSIKLPVDELEDKVLKESWLDLQNIARYEHTYGSKGNDYVHNYLEKRIVGMIDKDYIEYDNDMNYTNNILFNTAYGNFNSVSYYESNNLIVKINGTDKDLPALLVSAHYDSVPSSFGVTDDGMGVASLLGLLNFYSSKDVEQPARTIILNFNNDEEFGLYGATSFLSHPWFKQIKYFLNLEGTGAGGKAVLFRGTDYGIIKHFKGVRYPYGTSLFQQGFNNHLIHSETDYKIYKEKGGIRGLDLAFYKPRDLYHTASDNIQNINIKSLWHMLSNSVDVVGLITSKRIDLDEEYLESDSPSSSHEFAAYTSFFNWFFVVPISQLILINVIVLIIIPLVSLPFLIIIFNYRRNWDINFVNVIKYPVSLGLSAFALNLITNKIIASINEFLPNSAYGLLVTTLFALFLLLNYLILNGINLIFSGYKIVNHDEKLIVIIQNSFIYWVALIWSTVKLSKNKIGDDHTGEFPIFFLFLLQSIASVIGLIGWTFKQSNKPRIGDNSEESQPLLEEQNNDYGSNENSADERGVSSSSSSISLNSTKSSNRFIKVAKSFSYDWSIQFLTIVPISSFIIYNSGYMILDGLNKSIQESLNAESLIYNLVQGFAIVWVISFLPFVFKINRIMVLALILVIVYGFISISILDPFDQLNPLKLRFIQTIDLDVSLNESFVNVYGRENSPLKDVLNDIPSLKRSAEPLVCNPLPDGMQVCSYKSELAPHLIPNVKNFKDYIDIDIIKNSSSNVDYPFGLLGGEFKINVPKNRMCNLNFNLSESTTDLLKHKSYFKETPVKTVIVYADKKDNNEGNSSYKKFNSIARNDVELTTIPEGFSKDKDGNYIFKDLGGIDQLLLNKLDWDKSYHIGVQWVPNIIDISEIDAENLQLNKLGIKIDCFWADLNSISDNSEIKQSIPAYEELLHYSPNYVSWANKDRGLVSVSASIEI